MAYRVQDAFGVSLKGTVPAILVMIEHWCTQILQWRGIESEKPLGSIGISGFYLFMELFHFNVIAQSANFSRDVTLLDKMKIQHAIKGEELTQYNLIKSE